MQHRIGHREESEIVTNYNKLLILGYKEIVYVLFLYKCSILSLKPFKQQVFFEYTEWSIAKLKVKEKIVNKSLIFQKTMDDR